jgi:predicted permease
MISSVVDGVIPVALLIAFGFALGKRGVFGPDATVMLALVSILAIHGEARRALLLLAVTPTATTAGILSLHYRAYVKEASPTILVTTVLSIIAYPVILALT